MQSPIVKIERPRKFCPLARSSLARPPNHPVVGVPEVASSSRSQSQKSIATHQKAANLKPAQVCSSLNTEEAKSLVNSTKPLKCLPKVSLFSVRRPLFMIAFLLALSGNILCFEQYMSNQSEPQRTSGRLIKLRTSIQLNGRLSGPVRVLTSGNNNHRPASLAQKLQSHEFPNQHSELYNPKATQFGLRAVSKSPDLLLSTVSQSLPEPDRLLSTPLIRPNSAGTCRDNIGAESEAVTPTIQLAASSPTLRLTRPTNTNLDGASNAEEREEEEEEATDAVLRATPGILDKKHPVGASEASNQHAESIMSLIDEYDSKIITNRTKAHLSCDSGEMVLRLNFSEPYRGIVYPDHNRLSPCRFFGDGHHNYELRLPLRGCGTRQAAPRVFVNDIIVRFHKTLELEEDEVKTLICRYPPPLAPIPIDSVRPEKEGTPPFELLTEQHNNSNIETLSENLLLLSSTGQQLQPGGNQQQLSQQVAPYDRASTRGKLREPTGTSRDPYSSRNSLLNEGPSSEQVAPAPNEQQVFEHFGTLELLLLGSSLLFLVLLMTGLALSYCCIRRRARHRSSSSRRASAILSQTRRFAARSPHLHAHMAHAGSLHRHSHQHLAPQVGGRRMMTNQNQTAPSSPESDLSATGPLVAPVTGGKSASNLRSLYTTGGHINAAFASDAPQYKAIARFGHTQGRKQAVAGFVPPIQHGGNSVLGRRLMNNRPELYQLPGHPFKNQASLYQPLGGGGDASLAPLVVPNWQRATYRPLPVDDQHHLSPGQLWRANSLSAIRTGDQQQQQQQLSSQPHRGYLDLNELLFARHGEVMSNTTGRTRNRVPIHANQYFNHPSNNTDYKRRQRRIEDDEKGNLFNPADASQGGHFMRHQQSSDSEADDLCQLPEFTTSEQQQHHYDDGKSSLLKGKKKPKILLKSIEDSYITNLTEIQSQEYMKRDTLKPLSLANWRLMQQQQQENNNNNNNSSRDAKNHDTAKSSKDNYEKLEQQFSDDSQPDHFNPSTHTNLRSLTELDVHYAKQIHVQPLTSANNSHNIGQAPDSSTASLDQLTGQDPLTNSELIVTRLLNSTTPQPPNVDNAQTITNERNTKHRRSNSVPEVIVTDDQLRKNVTIKKPKAIGATGEDSEESLDLILSPEYDYTRLQLESTPAHKSVSYV